MNLQVKRYVSIKRNKILILIQCFVKQVYIQTGAQLRFFYAALATKIRSLVVFASEVSAAASDLLSSTAAILTHRQAGLLLSPEYPNFITTTY